MSSVPETLKFNKTHEWVRLEGDVAVIGITDHAQAELGDVVYVDLPEVGLMVEVDGHFGEVESVKAVSELYSPVSGEVVAANEALKDATQLVNEAPFEAGWMIKVRMSKPEELNLLLSAADYTQFLEQE